MTDTNMTDTNYHHDSGGVPQDGGKHMRVIQRNSEQEKCMGPCVGLRVLPLVVWFRGLLCSVWRNTSGVVLGVLVVIVAGSRPVVLFEPGC